MDTSNPSSSGVEKRRLLVSLVFGATVAWGVVLSASATYMLWGILAHNLGLSMEISIWPAVGDLVKSLVVVLAGVLALRQRIAGIYLLALIGLWLMVSTVVRSGYLLYHVPALVSPLSLLPSVIVNGAVGLVLAVMGRAEVRRLKARSD